MPAAAATGIRPQTLGGNSTQGGITGWKKEKKKKKAPPETKLPPFPNLRTYQPMPLCGSLPRKKPAWYAFHQVEQQVVQYAAQILLQQQKQQSEQPKKKQQQPQQSKKSQQQQTSRRQKQQKALREQQQHKQQQDGSLLQQNLQRQIQTLLNQHQQLLEQEQEPLGAVNGTTPPTSAIGAAGQNASSLQRFGSNTAAATKTLADDCRTTFENSNDTCNLKGDGWTTNGSTCDGSTYSSSKNTGPTIVIKPTTMSMQNGAVYSKESHQQPQNAVSHSASACQQSISPQHPYAYCFAASNDASCGSYPTDNFVMVARRRSRDVRPLTATAGAAAAPERTPPTLKNSASLRKAKKPAAVDSTSGTRFGRASPRRLIKKSSPPNSSPRQQKPTAAPPAPYSPPSPPFVIAPALEVLRATFITEDDRFVEMKSALRRYWKDIGKKACVDDLLCRESVPLGTSVTPGSITPPPAEAGEGGYVPRAAQRYFKARVRGPQRTRIEARWIPKHSVVEDGLERGAFLAEAEVGSANSRDVAGEAASDICTTFIERGWSTLTGTAEAAMAAETAEAGASAFAKNVEAPVIESLRQKIDTFYSKLAVCLRELLASRDPFFRLAYLTVVYNWFCVNRLQVEESAVYKLERISTDCFGVIAAASVPLSESGLSPAVRSAPCPLIFTATALAGRQSLNLLSSKSRFAAFALPSAAAGAVGPCCLSRAPAELMAKPFEAEGLRLPELPLLPEAAAFDVNQLSQCSGSAFYGCADTSEGETSPKLKQLSDKLRLWSLDSTNSNRNATESSTISSDSGSRNCSNGDATSRRVPNDENNTIASRKAASNRGDCSENNLSMLAQASFTCNSSTSQKTVDANPVRDVAGMRRRYTVNTMLPAPTAAPSTAVAEPPPSAEVSVETSARGKAFNFSAAESCATACRSEEKQGSSSDDGGDQNATTHSETSFLKMVQQHFPFITPMDRLREYETRALLRPSAAAAFQLKQQSRLASAGAGFSQCAPSWPAAVREATVSSFSAAPPVLALPDETAANNAPSSILVDASSAAPLLGSINRPAATLGKNVTFRPSGVDLRGRTTTQQQQMQQTPQQEEERPQQQWQTQQQQHIGPQPRHHMVQQNTSTVAAAAGQDAAWLKADSMEKEMAARSDLRSEYLGDWRVIRPPWGMQTAAVPGVKTAAVAGLSKGTCKNAISESQNVVATSACKGKHLWHSSSDRRNDSAAHVEKLKHKFYQHRQEAATMH